MDVSDEKIAKWFGFDSAREALQEFQFTDDFALVRKLLASGYAWSGRHVMPDYYASSWVAADGLRAVCVEDGPSYAVHTRPTRKARWNNAATVVYPTAAEAMKAMFPTA